MMPYITSSFVFSDTGGKLPGGLFFPFFFSKPPAAFEVSVELCGVCLCKFGVKSCLLGDFCEQQS